METSGEGSENARKVKNGKGKPDWAKSKVYHQKDGKKVIEVQFDFEEIAIPEHLKTEKLEKSSVLQTLILFPQSDGSYVPYFLNIYPDSPEKKFKLQDFMEGGYQKIPQDFSGVYRFYRWNGNFISGWRIKDGVKTHRIKESKRSNQADKSARTSSFTLYCYELVTTWYQYSCSETFGCTEPIAIGETVSGTECDLVVAPPSPNNPGESGGGGGGTPPNTGENCEEPEGNLEGVTVECDEEDPSELDCEINEAELSQIFPNGDSTILGVLRDLINAYGVDFGLIDENIVAHFISQAGHETNGFSSSGFSENLYYTTPERLLKVFPSKFSLTDPNKKNPNDYLRDPEKLANLVYSYKNGNGSESSGDGYKYRGRGAFQLTGKDNYSGFTNFYRSEVSSQSDFLLSPDLIESDIEIGILSAMWYFKDRVLDKISGLSELTVDKVTKLINGSFKAGLDDRKNWFETALGLINC